VIVGGETNPLWLTTDLAHIVSASIDKWRTQTSIRPSYDFRNYFFPAPPKKESEEDCGCPISPEKNEGCG
jgi:hypothetical protein